MSKYLLKVLVWGAIIICFSCQMNQAQEVDTTRLLIDSKAILLESYELSQQEEDGLSLALEKLNSVDAHDTNFVLVEYEKALYYTQLDSFNQVVNICRQHTNDHKFLKLDWFSLLGNAYIQLENYDSALVTFENGLKIYPYSTKLKYNRAVVFSKQKKHQEAIQILESLILENPYYHKSHFLLGEQYFSTDKLIPAFIAYVTGITFNNRSELLPQVYRVLYQIADVNASNWHRCNDSDCDCNKKLEELFLSKITLKKDFKSMFSVEDRILRQLELVMTYLPQPQGDCLYQQFYYPLWKHIIDTKQSP